MKKTGKNQYITAFLKGNIKNGNGRIYNPEIIQDILKKFNKLNHSMLGELGHPSRDTGIISLSNTTHIIKSLSVTPKKLPRKKKKKLKKLGIFKKFNSKEPILYGEFKLYPNDQGKLISALIDETDGLVVRPRGIGTINEKGEVQPGYEIITFDLIPKSEDSFKDIL